MEIADARPEKSLFLEMFIRDLTLEDSILDLIDNSIDSLIRNKGINITDTLIPLSEKDDSEDKDNLATISITLASNKLVIADNCGGISVKSAKEDVFRFGHAGNSPSGQLGVYGIGMKRAIFKIGNNIMIESKTANDAFRMNIDVGKWKEDRFNWSLPFEIINVGKPEENGTKIIIDNFRKEVKERINSGSFFGVLKEIIQRTYSLFLNRYVRVLLNGLKLDPISIPFAYSKEANIAKEVYKDGEVDVTIYAGLGVKDLSGNWKTDNAGWYIACNGRLVVVADKTALTMWGNNAPLFMPKYRGFVGIVFFYSCDPLLLPWTTTKRGINQESLVYQKARGRMLIISQPILRFMDNMYKAEEPEAGLAERQVADTIKAMDIRSLTQIRPIQFATVMKEVQIDSISVQYSAKISEISRIKKSLNKYSWSASKIGRYTLDHYLKTECPE